MPIEQHWFLAIRLPQGTIIYAGLRRDRADALEAASEALREVASRGDLTATRSRP